MSARGGGGGRCVAGRGGGSIRPIRACFFLFFSEAPLSCRERVGGGGGGHQNRNIHTSIYNRQCHLPLIPSLPLTPPSATSPSCIICARNTAIPSSSRCPAMSIPTSTHPSSSSSSPPSFPRRPCSPSSPPRTPPPPPPPPSPRASSGRFPSSAFTPTIASVPSAKHSLALPLALGRRSVSATRGRKEVGVRASGRMGRWREREVWR